jgi:serine/threonine-protein kinase HipA
MSSRAGARLNVFLGDEALGEIERRGPSRFRFTYSQPALERHGEGAVVLSASLPAQKGSFAPARTAPFFEGLLPEGAVRASIAKSFRLSEEDGFGLLDALGADCAGAVSVLPVGMQPTAVGRLRSLDTEELIHLIEELPRHPLGVDTASDGVRLSLGGIQPKLVLAGSDRPVGFAGGRSLTGFSQPLEGAPSTCLLKPELGLYEDLVANEAFCMSVARGVGLRVAATELLHVGSTPCLYVERFDRAGDGPVTRIHQEDMCQALGILPAAKYEENGGPSMRVIVELLRDLQGPYMARDLNEFIHAVLVNYLLGNSDAHGKNFALLYMPEEGIRLAPLYDIVSTAVYPEVTGRMAMSIGGTHDPDQVDMAAWLRLADECGFGGGMAGVVRRRAATAVRVVEAHREMFESNGRYRPVIGAIVDVCRERAKRLIEGS